MKTKMLCGLWLGALALAGGAWGAPGTNAYDQAGNYTLATFTNGANLGFGFGAWDLWNTPATLGDSTAGGGGNLNSTNGYSFRFMGDGGGGWCNGKRNFGSALQKDDVLSFTFTYNWDGGGRGVDIFSATGQFANVIDVSGGNTFKVNGTTISTVWSPGAVVAVEITQLTNGVQVHLTRETNGVENLNYTTNILNAQPATGFSLYCGGYSCAPADNVNYAIFMNKIRILGEPPKTLTFTGGTWNPSVVGAYPFELTRSGAVGDAIVLTSSNTNSVTVPASATFAAGSNTVSFNATVVSLTAGEATIVASNVASGAWAEYTVKPVAPTLSFTSGTWNPSATGGYTYTLERSASVGNEIVLTSTASNVLTVAPSVNFTAGTNVLDILATVVSLTNGPATLIASNAATGAWAEYVVTPVGPILSIDGPWLVESLGALTYTLVRTPSVGVNVLLSSSATNVLTVPADLLFGAGSYTSTFPAVAVGYGAAKIVASNAATGAWAEYNVTVQMPSNPDIGPITFVPGTGAFSFTVPGGFTLSKVQGAGTALVGGDLSWTDLVPDTDYTLTAGVVTILTKAAGAPAQRLVRIWVTSTPPPGR